MIENHFVVVVPVYNCEKWLKKCVGSILNQTYKNYSLIIINDGSTDGTSNILKAYHNKPNIVVVNNSSNVGSGLSNIIKGIKLIAKNSEDIIVTVDGDDSLYFDGVFDHLNTIYQNKNVWMTYGEFEPTNGAYHNISKAISDTRIYRKSGKWYASHLRTFKKWLFDKIDINDMKDKNGDFYKVAWDCAFMFPLIEMSGKAHLKFIDKILYSYNNDNEMNDMKAKRDLQIQTANEIRLKDEYDELK